MTFQAGDIYFQRDIFTVATCDPNRIEEDEVEGEVDDDHDVDLLLHPDLPQRMLQSISAAYVPVGKDVRPV